MWKTGNSKKKTYDGRIGRNQRVYQDKNNYDQYNDNDNDYSLSSNTMLLNITALTHFVIDSNLT